MALATEAQFIQAGLRKNIIGNIRHVFPTRVYEVTTRKLFEDVSAPNSITRLDFGPSHWAEVTTFRN